MAQSSVMQTKCTCTKNALLLDTTHLSVSDPDDEIKSIVNILIDAAHEGIAYR